LGSAGGPSRVAVLAQLREQMRQVPGVVAGTAQGLAVQRDDPAAFAVAGAKPHPGPDQRVENPRIQALQAAADRGFGVLVTVLSAAPMDVRAGLAGVGLPGWRVGVVPRTLRCTIALGHITSTLGTLDTRAERDWYAERAAENGWTRNVLEHHIKVNLRTALGAAPTNFTAALDSPDSELAQQLVDDQYRRPEIHAPTVGILLCTGKSGPTVRYALASTSAPTPVADYYGLPVDARAALPSAEELQAIVDAESSR
jgi:hypothetical protein